jgi:predicted short-subunit dehydrogenase-like oxidoreductase (DUF2520 family)
MTSMHFGLYGAGGVSSSWIACLPHLATRLGPVAASSYRVASRIANSLRAGHAVKDCAEFDGCRVVLISAPAAVLPDAVARLRESEIAWDGKIVLLCSPGPGSRALDALHRRGAATGSMHPIEPSPGLYLTEGDGPALREMRRLAHDLRGRTVELSSGGTAVYGAGIAFATSLFTPLLAAGFNALRKAGCTPGAAARLTEDLFQRTLRGWLHSGRKSWTGPVAEADLPEIRRQMEALAKHDPAAVRYYREAAVFALAHFKRHPRLLERLER